MVKKFLWTMFGVSACVAAISFLVAQAFGLKVRGDEATQIGLIVYTIMFISLWLASSILAFVVTLHLLEVHEKPPSENLVAKIRTIEEEWCEHFGPERHSGLRRR